jgi:acyl-CoA thioester hydrolase
MGVVYHANYLIWCEMGRTDLLRRLGTTYAELERQGVFLAISDVRIRFRSSASYDERIRVRTTLSRRRSRGVTFSYEVEKASSAESLASAETDLICLDADRRPSKLPADVMEILQRALPAGSRGGGTNLAQTGVEKLSE